MCKLQQITLVWNCFLLSNIQLVGLIEEHLHLGPTTDRQVFFLPKISASLVVEPKRQFLKKNRFDPAKLRRNILF